MIQVYGRGSCRGDGWVITGQLEKEVVISVMEKALPIFLTNDEDAINDFIESLDNVWDKYEYDICRAFIGLVHDEMVPKKQRKMRLEERLAKIKSGQQVFVELEEYEFGYGTSSIEAKLAWVEGTEYRKD